MTELHGDYTRGRRRAMVGVTKEVLINSLMYNFLATTYSGQALLVIMGSKNPLSPYNSILFETSPINITNTAKKLRRHKNMINY